jgi:hypothetical protein
MKRPFQLFNDVRIVSVETSQRVYDGLLMHHVISQFVNVHVVDDFAVKHCSGSFLKASNVFRHSSQHFSSTMLVVVGSCVR